MGLQRVASGRALRPAVRIRVRVRARVGVRARARVGVGLRVGLSGAARPPRATQAWAQRATPPRAPQPPQPWWRVPPPASSSPTRRPPVAHAVECMVHRTVPHTPPPPALHSRHAPCYDCDAAQAVTLTLHD
eukprot:scaffold31898_cov60-Phaeocystis_antarctica.AAC.1